MRIHHREENVRRATMALNKALIDTLTKEALTAGETIRVLMAVFGGHLDSIAKFAIRQERHGDEDKPGGLE
jgi:hydrogenase maturation factor